MTEPMHYLFALWDSAGTVPAELGVARRLVERGHRVTVLADPTMREESRDCGAAFLTWTAAPHRVVDRSGGDTLRDWEAKNPLSYLAKLRDDYLVDAAPHYAADVAAHLADDPAQVVVTDVLLLGAQLAGQAAGVPTVALVPNVYSFPVPGRPPFGTGWGPARSPLGRVRDRATAALLGRVFDKALPRFNEIREELGLHPLSTFWDQLGTLDRTLVLTSRAFDFPEADGEFPDNVRYVGPVLDDPTWVDDWTPPPGDDPLVLVGLSSGLQGQLAVLCRIVEALGTLPVRAVVTTGTAIDPSELPAPPPGVQIVRSAPHRQVLDHADAVVTHGGHGTLLKALAAGRPVLCMPMGRDQPDNAARLVRLGAGIKLKPSAKPPRVAKALAALLAQSSYREAAARVAPTLCTDSTSEAAVLELEHVARDPQASPT